MGENPHCCSHADLGGLPLLPAAILTAVRPLTLVPLLLIVLSGCSDDDPAPADAPNKRIRAARVGDSVQLESRRGERLVATVTGIQDPIRRHRFKDARVSGRFVGVELTLENRGDIGFRSSPWSGSRLTTTEGAERPTRLLQAGSCLGVRRVTLAPGSRGELCIPFRVEEGAEPLKFRYAPESGFAPAAGVWDLSER